MHRLIRWAALLLMHVGLLSATWLVGTACHEVIGHGLVAVALGGSVEGVELFCFRVYPDVEFIGWSRRYGLCDIDGYFSVAGYALFRLGGSMSTWCVSVAAVVWLYARRHRHGRIRTYVLAYLGIWWIDLVAYTLPTFGIRHSVLWGDYYSEPYEAVVDLGIPGWAFQAFVVTTCAALAAVWTVALVARHRNRVRGELQVLESDTRRPSSMAVNPTAT